MKLVCSKIVTRLMKRGLTDAWDGWRHHVREQQQCAGILCKQLMRWRNRAYSRAFDSWCEHVRAQKRLQAVSTKIASRLQNQSLAVSFETWRQCSISQRRVRKALTKVCLRWGMSACLKAFRRWFDTTHRGQQVDSKKTRALKRWCLRSVSAAFAQWGCWAHEEMGERRRLERIRIRVHDALRRLRHACTSKAWNAWTSFARRQYSLSRGLLKVLKRMKHKRMAASFGTWSLKRMDLGWRRELLHKALQQAACASVATAFGLWSLNAQLARSIRVGLANLQHLACGRTVQGQCFLRSVLQVQIWWRSQCSIICITAYRTCEHSHLAQYGCVNRGRNREPKGRCDFCICYSRSAKDKFLTDER